MTFFRALILLSVTCLAGWSQTQPDATLAAGRELAAGLKLEQAADQAVFERIGLDRANALLTAVMTRGMGSTATAQEWTEGHRAASGLIELNYGKGEWLKAAIFATFQEFSYRNNEGDYTAALAAARQALELQQKSGETASLFSIWQNMGEDLIRLGRLDEGLDSLYQAHHMIADPKSKAAGALWREIVDGEIARKNLDAARRECAEFGRVAEASPAIFHGRALLARADLEMEEGHYGDALNSVHAAADAMKGDEGAADFGWESAGELISMILPAMDTLPYAQAMELASRMDREFPDLPVTISPFARQAMNHRRRLAGEFDALLREDTAELEKARASKNVRLQLQFLRSLAVTYAFANGSRQQVALLEEAMQLEKSLLPKDGLPDNAVDRESYFNSLVILGSAYVDRNDSGKARKAFTEATHGIDSLPAGAARTRLARLYAEAELGKVQVAALDEDPDTARDILQKALNAPASGIAKFSRSAVLLAAARLERDLNEKPADAVRYYEEAIQAIHKEKNLRSEIQTRLQLARYLLVEGAKKIPDAQQRAADNLKVAETAAATIDLADAQWRVLFLEGIAAENGVKPAEAIDLYIKAVTKLDNLRAGLSQGEQRQAFMDDQSIQELYQRLTGLLTAAGRQQQAWEYLERGKARAFLEMLQGRRFNSNGTSAGVDELESLDKQIVNLRAQLAPENVPVLRGAGKEPALMQAELGDLESRFAVSRQQAALASSRSAQPLSLRPMAMAELQKALPDNSALIEYAMLDGGLTAFVATRSSTNQVQWKANTKTLASKIRALVDLLSNPESGEALGPALREMSAVLVDPVLKELPAGIDRLLIVPTQALNYIPFQVLLLADGRSMIDRFTISYLPSGSTLQYLKGQHLKASSEPFLGALGNVSVDGWAPLPGTLTETAGIQKLYPKAPLVTGAQFTHDRAVKALEESDEVHFATHGLFDLGAPLFSAILTAPAAGQPSRLSLYELTDLKLRASLVVLSACETNRGKLMGGDELTGLTRTFLLAGAEAVVSSLWRVSDDSTVPLMEDFYRGLRTGKSAAEALRQAELEVRKKFPHPFFWAPFVETGIE